MNDLEKTLNKLENEIKGLKDSFEQTGLQLPVFTYELNYRTKANRITITQSGYSPITFDGAGRTVVTFVTDYGVNTLATLEVEFNDGGYGLSDFKYRRIPYSGGARWIVYDAGGAIDYKFVVHSAVQGTLGAKMIWE